MWIYRDTVMLRLLGPSSNLGTNLLKLILKGRKQLAISVLIVDSRIGPTELDLQKLKWFQQNLLPFFIVSTKSDKLSKVELQKSSSTRGASLKETPRGGVLGCPGARSRPSLGAPLSPYPDENIALITNCILQDEPLYREFPFKFQISKSDSIEQPSPV